jgi:hypothetical protein
MPASTHTTSSSAATYSTKPCTKCGAKELQRKPRKLSQKLFALYPYVCLRCSNREIRFRIKAWGVVRLLILVALPVGAAIVYKASPGLFHKAADDSAQGGGADALARARATAGGLTAFEQMMITKPRKTMDNATVLKLWQHKVGADVILQLIRTSTPDYDVSASSIIELKDAGVDQSIILAMIDASYTAR